MGNLRRLMGMLREKWALGLKMALMNLAAVFLDTLVILWLSLAAFRTIDPTWQGGGMARLPRWVPVLAPGPGASPEARFQVLLLVMGAAVGAMLLRAFFQYGHSYLASMLVQKIGLVLRDRLFWHLESLPLSFYESRRTGELMSRTVNDVSMGQVLVALLVGEALSAPITILATLAVMMALSWKLTLLSIPMVLLMGWVIARAGRRMRRLTRSIQARLAEVNARLQERLSSVKEIQSFTMEEQEMREFSKVNLAAYRANLRAAKVSASLPPGVEFLGTFGMALGLCVAGWYVIHGQFDFPALLTFCLAVQKAGGQFSKMGRVYTGVQQGLAACDRIFEILDTPSQVRDLPGAVPLPRIRGELQFCGVSFRYPSGEYVLREVNFRVEPGEVLALAGPSGAGKTTLAHLVPRFYDPAEGTVLIDGKELRSVTLESLRKQVGIVPQETVLFSGTVYENIAYGRPGATFQEVVEAARAANAHPFIAELPGGYQAQVGERGFRLSAGQRQRISIARALLKDPRILILDEATSSLDAESEALVQEALERLMRGRTTIVIAHRLSTIRKAHRILVISDGRIVEEGSHFQLMAQRGLYSRLYQIQLEGAATPS